MSWAWLERPRFQQRNVSCDKQESTVGETWVRESGEIM
jgi:hypothetical protein